MGREVVAVTNDIFLVDDKPNAAMPAETQAAAAQVQVHKHYVTIFVRCEMRDPKAVPRVLEPEKCETWEWVDWRDVRRWAAFADPECRASANPGEEIRELFLPLVNLWKQCPGIEKALGQHD